ncbi:MAG: phosphoglycerate kinase [Candidatus Aenigmarchaeota archaeon]|nr:phosphoglycerate kinase [Candidatus Aenigmarchaeota archaeon]
MTMKNFLTLDDFDLKGKKVLVRVDINSPIDAVTKEITDDERLMAHGTTTIKELSEKGARVIILSHQGRAGDSDFISLEGHARCLSKYAGKEVKFIDAVFGKSVENAINEMRNGDIILLENTRFYSEETLERPPDALAHVHMVRKLAPLVDIFVNDAFGAIHRQQASLVGFGELLPTAAGRVVEKELMALNRVFDEKMKPVVFVFGGVKVDDSVKVIKNIMKNGSHEKILTGGLVANLFLVAKGYDIGSANMEILKGKGLDKLIPAAKEIIAGNGHRIETPVDLAVRDGERTEISVSELPTPLPISDIGRETVGRYCKILEDAKTIVFSSPVGQYEDERFRYGTKRLLEFASQLEAFKIVGGGHIAETVNSLGIRDKFDHISTGGRATLYHLSGEKTPVITMLQKAKEKLEKQKE